MDFVRMTFMLLGLIAVIGGALMLFFEAGLERWISMTILLAGVLIFVGIAVIGFASSAPRDPPPRERREPPPEERPPEDRRR